MSSGRRFSGDPAGALDAYEAAPAVMLALEGDEMVLASANEAARAAFGERCEYGRPAREIASEIDGGTRRLMDEMVGTVLATGRSITTPGHRVTLHEPEGVPSEVFWDLTVSPWFADDGSVRGVLAHGVDVTERTRARDAPDELHDITALQDALLPEWLPVLPGVEVSGRYLLGRTEMEAGGDWYDVVGLPDGSVALVVGDVAGHGVPAAAGMGRLRAVMGERLSSGTGLTATMQALDSFARTAPEAGAATVCVVVVDPVTGRLDYCTAGHPPPLVVRPDGRRARFLAHTGAAPLATTGEMTVGHDHLDQGDLVLLYTDGLLTRPGRGPAISTVELGQVATDAAAAVRGRAHRGPADRVCEQALEAMTHATGYHDDIAVLVAEVTKPAAPLHLDVAADDEAVPQVIEEIAVWLEAMRVRDLDHIVIQHAVDELISNMVDHAYSAEPATGRVVVDAGLLGNGELELRFTDTGTWAPPDGRSDRGRGLAIVRGMVDRLALEGTDGGTVATVHHRLSRPAHLLTGQATEAGPTASEERFSLSMDVDCLQLSGSMDHVAVGVMRHALREVAGRERVVVDLEGITRLPSSAVQALHHACRDATERGHELMIYAPPGTTAQHVLELVRLPYVMRPPVG